jgi:hypothetical protein
VSKQPKSLSPERTRLMLTLAIFMVVRLLMPPTWDENPFLVRLAIGAVLYVLIADAITRLLPNNEPPFPGDQK